MVDYCLQKNIITQDNVKYTVQSQLIVHSDNYNSFIDKCYNEFPDDLRDSIIGNFKPNTDTHVVINSVCVTESYIEAMFQYIKNNNAFTKI